MKLQNKSRIGPSLALCLGLLCTASLANAHETSTGSPSGPDAGQAGGDKAAGMNRHHSYGDDHNGHHGKNGYSGHHGKSGHGGMQTAPTIELDLDADQLEDIAEIQRELRSDLTDLKVERYEASLKLEELYAAEELDAGDIVDQQQKVFDVIKEITELQVEAQQDIRDLLTDEQKNKLLQSGDWLMPN
ncbi:Spy/CpxP family protein refolding chaperone [Marinobacter halotolerans]|uniref:Spy/CpxP family protein refolding chaperone n=1 Tax=Marinobacter halotolerans TaxID=1569211 RepID=UPI0012464EF8|nr:hypothetical protein [Marinobacter halotolerans]